MRGLHVKEAAPYLLPLGLRPVADGLGLTMSAHLTTSAANAAGDQISANLDIDKLAIVADGQPAVLGRENQSGNRADRHRLDRPWSTLTIDDVKLASGRQPGWRDPRDWGLSWSAPPPPAAPGKIAPASVAQQPSSTVPMEYVADQHLQGRCAL